MNRYMPDMYKKDIFSINYKKLKKDFGIKVLVFDFDNTIIEHKNNNISLEVKSFIDELKKDFDIYILSNSLNYKKLSLFSETLGVPFIGGAFKPLTFGYKKLGLKVSPFEVACIGDQLVTDIYGAHKLGYFAILVDAIRTDNEIIFTKINRIFERRKMKTINLKRGDYFE